MSMDSWFPNPHDKDIAQLEEGLAYRAIKSGNNWILPSGKNAANGDPVVVDGVFGYATAAIVGGTDAIVEDTNWKPYGDGGALGKLNNTWKLLDTVELKATISVNIPTNAKELLVCGTYSQLHIDLYCFRQSTNQAWAEIGSMERSAVGSALGCQFNATKDKITYVFQMVNSSDSTGQVPIYWR